MVCVYFIFQCYEHEFVAIIDSKYYCNICMNYKILDSPNVVVNTIATRVSSNG